MIRASFDGFLDRAAIKQVLGKTAQRFAVRSGSYVQAAARYSIRIRKKPLSKLERDSRVGQPPTSRTRYFKNSILFAYDQSSGDVLIGPTGGKKDPSPAAFEEGGVYPITVRTKRGRKRTVGRYRKFPTMGPALVKSAPKLSEFWNSSFGP